MEGYAVLMFCFAGCLFIYAGILAKTKNPKLIPRHDAAEMKDKKLYTEKVATATALAALAPLASALVASFSSRLMVVVTVTMLSGSSISLLEQPASMAPVATRAAMLKNRTMLFIASFVLNGALLFFVLVPVVVLNAAAITDDAFGFHLENYYFR